MILMFGSIAYQGLTNDQRVIDAAKAAPRQVWFWPAGSRFPMVRSICTVQPGKGACLSLWARMKLCVSTGFL